MARTDIYIKVEVEHDSADHPEDIAGELCRVLLKNYGVRSADLSSFVTRTAQGE
ncbi:MAG: hypothetical protein ABSG25_02125 [Bryobacteraceae bacterium]